MVNDAKWQLVFLSLFLSLIFTACSGEPPPAATRVEAVPSSPEVETRVESLPSSAPAGAVDADVAEPTATGFVAYFGSFRDRQPAFRYSLALPGTYAERTVGGHFLIVTKPMDRASADEEAEKRGGRVLTLDDLQALIESN